LVEHLEIEENELGSETGVMAETENSLLALSLEFYRQSRDTGR